MQQQHKHSNVKKAILKLAYLQNDAAIPIKFCMTKRTTKYDLVGGLIYPYHKSMMVDGSTFTRDASAALCLSLCLSVPVTGRSYMETVKQIGIRPSFHLSCTALQGSSGIS